MAVPFAPPTTSSMDDLNEDVLHHILSFVPSARSLSQFALTSKRACHMVYDDSSTTTSDDLFDTLYEQAYGSSTTTAAGSSNRTFLRGGKEKFKSLQRLRESIVHTGRRLLDDEEEQQGEEETTVPPPRRTSLGILADVEEVEALFYDHGYLYPDEDDNNVAAHQYCLGYFNCRELPNSGPVVIWGDFNGVRIAPSLDHLLLLEDKDTDTTTPPHPEDETFQFQTVGDGSQVLAVLIPPPPPPVVANKGSSSSSFFFFLGCASGILLSIDVVVTNDGAHIYTTKSTSSLHSNEVTALALWPMHDKGTNNASWLVSSCVGGKVCLYPHAPHSGSFDDSMLLYQASDGVFSLGATLCHDGTRSRSLLCLCERDGDTGYLSVWEKHSCGDFEQCGRDDLGEGVLVTRLLVLHENSDRIVTGTNSGQLCLWKIAAAAPQLDDLETCKSPQFQLLQHMKNAHEGTIESAEVIGNILLTCGGRDGLVKGWDLNLGCLLGLIPIHPGRLYPPVRERGRKQICIKSAVVSSFFRHDSESLVSLCRDGTIKEWKYGDIAHTISESAAHRKSLLEASQQLRMREGGILLSTTSSKPPCILSTHVAKKSWDTMFLCLVEYRAEHGECADAQKGKEHRKLGKWVKSQRAKRNTMARYRRDRLDSIGFAWSTQGHKGWDSVFERLVKYQSEHGTCALSHN